MKNVHIKGLKFLLYIYIVGILFFTLIRFGLLLTELKQLKSLPEGESLGLIFKAFVMGFRFDTVISGYILALPALIFTFTGSINYEHKAIYRFVSYYVAILYSVALLICFSNIPYFNHFYAHINIIALAWMDTPQLAAGMILNDSAYLLFLLAAIVSVTLFIFIVRYLSKNILAKQASPSKVYFSWKTLAVSILSLAVIMVGIRGRLSRKSPIRIGTAYFSSYAFPNQLGLNPVFVFLRSVLDSKKEINAEINLIDSKLAIEYIQKSFGISNINPQYPISRYVSSSKPANSYNLVVVLMESMMSNNMKRYGNKSNITPILDSLANQSLCFDNFYSAGIHTYNGIFSTCYAHPSLLSQHPMKRSVMSTYMGLPNVLQANGYQTLFFTTHDAQFDNMEGFLHNNAFEQVISQKDYPSSEVLSTLGVPDHYMLTYAINTLTKAHESGKPFFSVLLTASNHKPIVIPENISFKPTSEESSNHIIEYADWAIGQFLEEVKHTEWFENTVFIFVADHGYNSGENVYDISLTHNQIPCMIYAPKLVEPQSSAKFGCQIDIFPTAMNLLGISYTNNTLGVDLLSEERPCVYFASDDKLACLDDEYMYVYRTNGIESLYKYRELDTENYLTSRKEKADSLKTYAFSMMQVSQWMIKNNKLSTAKK